MDDWQPLVDMLLPQHHIQSGFGLNMLIEEIKRAHCPICRDESLRLPTVPDNDIRSETDGNSKARRGPDAPSLLFGE